MSSGHEVAKGKDILGLGQVGHGLPPNPPWSTMRHLEAFAQHTQFGHYQRVVLGDFRPLVIQCELVVGPWYWLEIH